jgi:hypothetical protein
MLKGTVQLDRPQLTTWCMRIACWITKDTNTHSEYLIHIAFPQQQWLQERASMFPLYIHCLSCNASGCHLKCFILMSKCQFYFVLSDVATCIATYLLGFVRHLRIVTSYTAVFSVCLFPLVLIKSMQISAPRSCYPFYLLNFTIKILITGTQNSPRVIICCYTLPSCLRIFCVYFNTSMNIAGDCPSFALHEALHPLITSFPIRKSKLPNFV